MNATPRTRKLQGQDSAYEVLLDGTVLGTVYRTYEQVHVAHGGGLRPLWYVRYTADGTNPVVARSYGVANKRTGVDTLVQVHAGTRPNPNVRRRYR